MTHKTNPMKLRPISKGQRAHVRRLKQEARNDLALTAALNSALAELGRSSNSAGTGGSGSTNSA